MGIEKNNKLYFFALAALGRGLSGSDRIFVELARRWSKTFLVNIYVWREGLEMCQRQNLDGKNVTFHVSEMKFWRRFGFLLNYIARIVEGIRLGLTVNLATGYNLRSTVVYSASEFWMDSLPCLILKLRYPKIRWIASWYQTAPNPLVGYQEQGVRSRKYHLSAFAYWTMQLPVKPLIAKFADKVIVNNEKERKRFPDLDRHGRVIVLIGAVPLESIEKFLTTNYKLLTTKKYDAVFQGRFHPQKGVVELVDIWKKVVDKKPNAKLAMIGDGPLMEDVKKHITINKLTNNIKLFGYVFDGPEKYKILMQSKIVVHPAFYDSGGMAAAEAMAFGLPCVGFNLKSYESYYPQGMIKVSLGNLQEFSDVIINLMDNKEVRLKVGKAARQMIVKNWSWDKRASEVLRQIM